MTGITAVGIYNNLSSRQSAVPMRTSDHKPSGRIHEKLGVLIHQLRRKHLIKNIRFHILMYLFLFHVRIMLCRKNNRFQPERLAVLIILHRHLALSVRTQIRQCAVLADLCQTKGQLMGQCNGIRHIFCCLIAGKAEHHSLIPGADGIQLCIAHPVLLCLQSLIHTHGNIPGLFVQCHDHTAGIAVKAIFCIVIANLPNRVPYHLLNIHIALGGNLSHYQHQACGRTSLTSHPAHRILRHHGIQHGIRNGITHFIRMPLCHRLGCKQ